MLSALIAWVATPPATRARRLIGAALAAAVVGLLAALPVGAARASSPAITPLETTKVESLLGETPLSELETSQLTELLSKLPALDGLQAGKLKEAIEKTVAKLREDGGSLQELLSGSEGAQSLLKELEKSLGLEILGLGTLLGGNPLTKLTEALKSDSPQELLGELLGKAEQPQQLIQDILASLSPQRLEELLGSSLSGEAFSELHLSELAGKIGTTPETIDGDLGKTGSELSGAAMTLTAPLTSGKELAVLDGVKGLTLGLLEGTGDILEGAGGGSGGAGSGGTGGSGGPGGSSGSGGGTTVVIQNSQAASPGPSAARTSSAGKLKLIAHSVKGHTATILVQVPSAGYLTLAARGMRSLSRQTARAERVTLTAALTRAGIASLRKHHRRMKLSVKVSFRPTSGASSSATLSVLFR